MRNIGENPHMAKLIAILGNCGTGKTTLANLICDALDLQPYLEDHAQRAYHAATCGDKARYALPNQVDFMLARAEQERHIHRQAVAGVVDGGLEQDFHLFTRLFHRRGYLNDADYALCGRLYTYLRGELPPPDLVIHLHAPLDLLRVNREKRKRAADMVGDDDLELLEGYLEAWLQDHAPAAAIRLEVTPVQPPFADCLPQLIKQIQEML